jgi:hypothetical protein
VPERKICSSARRRNQAQPGGGGENRLVEGGEMTLAAKQKIGHQRKSGCSASCSVKAQRNERLKKKCVAENLWRRNRNNGSSARLWYENIN